MEYRLIRHAVTGETRVIGGDGLVSAPLAAADYLTQEGELRSDWWRVGRADYCTALWQHPLWRVLAHHDADAGTWWVPQTAGDAGFAFALDSQAGRGEVAAPPWQGRTAGDPPQAGPSQEAE